MIKVKADALQGTANILNKNGNHALLAMFGADERATSGKLAIYCLFAHPDKRDVDILKAEFDKNEDSYESLTSVIPASAWYEREIFDMFGLKPKNHPDLRPLVLHENFPEGFHPLLKTEPVDKQIRGTREYEMAVSKGEGLFEVPVGPIHAGIIEPGHFRFSQAGESMLQLDAKLFFTHRGIEKAMEGKTPFEALAMAERICGACSIANTWSYCQAVEKIAGVTVPKKAEIIRTLLLEMERLYNHVGDLGNIPAGVGFSPAISLGNKLKELLMRCNEVVTGNRFLRGMLIPGGVKFDLTEEIVTQVLATLEDVEKGFLDLVQMMEEQDEFKDRIRTTGILRYSTAKDLAMVGVGARASGIKADSRKDFKYGIYDELDFALITKEVGDVEARIQVRIEETKETLKLVRQLIEKWRTTLDVQLICEVPLKAGQAWGVTESARGNNVHWITLDDNGKIDRIFIRSASYPNWPGVAIATNGDIIPDFPLINKSFELCYACIDR